MAASRNATVGEVLAGQGMNLLAVVLFSLFCPILCLHCTHATLTLSL